MSVVRAPGKLVLSGAYSVLWGAPALVSAVDRYAIADSAKESVHASQEVGAAIELGILERHCFVDVSALRAPSASGGTRKLGLGSSAAILLSSMGAQNGVPNSADGRAALFAQALSAHRRAQGGGSGIDVAASTFGGVRSFWLSETPNALPEHRPHPLPATLHIAVFESPVAAVTSQFVRQVRAFSQEEPGAFAPLMAQAKSGAVAAYEAKEGAAFIEALEQQAQALDAIGTGAKVAIVTDEVRALRKHASQEGASFVPSGAGGGDITLFVGLSEPSPAFLAHAADLQLSPLSLGFGAEGLSVVS